MNSDAPAVSFFPSMAHFEALCMNGDVYRRDWMYLLMFTENSLLVFLKMGCCLNFIHHSKVLTLTH